MSCSWWKGGTWGLAAILAACGSPPERAATAPPSTGAPLILDEAPTAETPEDDAPLARLEMWWSDAGTAVARCLHDGEVALTLLTASGEQQPLPIDYPQAGWAPHAIGAPAWQPGAEIVALPHDRGVVLWDATTRRTRATLAVVGGTSAPEVSYSPDGKRLATFLPLDERESAEHAAVALWDPSGALVRQVRPDGRALLPTRQISLGDDVVATSAGVILSMVAPPIVGDRVVVTSTTSNAVKVLDGHTVAVSAAGLWAVSSGLDGGDGLAPASTTIYGAFGRDALATVAGRHPAWTVDGKALKTEGEDAVVLSAADGRTLLRVPTTPRGFSSHAEPSPRGTMLAVAEEEVAVWDVASKRRTRIIAGTSIAGWLRNDALATFGRDGHVIHVASTQTDERVDVSASLQGGVCRLRLATAEGEGPAGAALTRILGASPPPASAVEPGPRAVPDPAARLTHGEARPSIEGALSWSPDQATFVATSPGRPRTLVDLRTGAATTLPEAPQNATYDAQQLWWNDASTHVAFRASGAVEVWERASARRVGRVVIADGAHAEVSWAPSAGRLAIAWFSDAARVTVFDVAAGRAVTFAPSPPELPAVLSWRPDGRQLLTRPGQSLMQLEQPTELQVWDARSGRPVSSFTPTSADHVQATSWAAWHPSGAVLYTGAGEGTYFNLSYFTGSQVSRWDAATGRRSGSLPGHTALVEPTEKRLVVLDGHSWRSHEAPRATVYDVKTLEPLASLSGVPLAFDPKGRWVITATYPYSSSNMPSSSPVIYQMWDLPGETTPKSTALRGRLALGTFDDQEPVDYAGDGRFVVWSHNGFHDDVLRFVVWDLATSSRVAAGRFDDHAAITGRQWLRGGRILQLRYDDGRHRFIAVDDGTSLDVTAEPDGSLHIHDATGAASWSALAKLLER